MDFQVDKHAVSILHSRLILREDTSWGVYRLAVQGTSHNVLTTQTLPCPYNVDPMIPRSNLARAASSDKGEPVVSAHYTHSARPFVQCNVCVCVSLLFIQEL